MKLIHRYKNGNYTVSLFSDGTKIRHTEDDEFYPRLPENVDCKITDRCDGGCQFCYEGCTTEGKHGDLFAYPQLLNSLYGGMEFAINGNDLTHPDLPRFLMFLKEKKVIANMTVNQKHFEKHFEIIKSIIVNEYIHGLGISLVNPTDDFIEKVKCFPNAVIHVINGVVTEEQLEKLADNGLKVLILGYKEMERGIEYLNKHDDEINANMCWLYDNLGDYFKKFKCLSFDNLALNQLDVKRLMSEEEWNKFYMGDDGSFTFYIDMVEGTFGKNSLTPRDRRIPIGDKTIEEMFKIVREHNWEDKTEGFHDGGIGYNPHGIWCGECTKITCHGCVNEHLTEEIF